MKVGKRDSCVIENLVEEYCGHFGFDYGKVMNAGFRTMMSVSKDP